MHDYLFNVKLTRILLNIIRVRVRVRKIYFDNEKHDIEETNTETFMCRSMSATNIILDFKKFGLGFKNCVTDVQTCIGAPPKPIALLCTAIFTFMIIMLNILAYYILLLVNPRQHIENIFHNTIQNAGLITLINIIYMCTVMSSC